jgi:hypothetical protein
MDFLCKLFLWSVFVAHWRSEFRRKKMDKARVQCTTILHRISSCAKILFRMAYAR